MADMLGQPFMPWQALVADVGCEINPATGLPAYREVRVTVPRQSGKTTLFLSWQINRCVSRRWRHPQRSVFTAQTGKDARDKWIDELFPLIRNSRLKSLVATTGERLVINEGMGNESVLFKTGSRIRLLSTSTSSGHSKTLHQAVMDEVWHDTDDRREQGLRPAMITNPDAQLLVCSTAGTEDSLVLNRKVESGRAAVEADTGTGVAYFEWSAPVDDFDPYDEAAWYTFMPALCPAPPCRCAGPGESWRHTITSLDAIRAERDDMDPDEFKRAYGNVPTSQKDLKWQVVSQATWASILDLESSPVDPVVFAVDVTPERSHSAVAVVGGRRDRQIHGEIVDHRPGTEWVVDRVVELVDRWKPKLVVVDPAGAAGSLVADLAAALHKRIYGFELTLLNARQVAQGYGMFHDTLSAAAPRRLFVRDEFGSPLTSAVAGAATRRIGDGTTWDRKTTATDISPLVALTNALHGFMSLPPPLPPPTAPTRPATTDLKSIFRPSQRLKL